MRRTLPRWWRMFAVNLGLLFGVLTTAGAMAAGDGPTAQALFAKMAEATRNLNYNGVFVYQRGNHTDSMRIIHRNDENGEQERLVSLSGPAREVIRNRETVTCIFPENKSVMVEKSRPRKLFPALTQPVADIARHYRFVLLGKDRVAGRPAWNIGIQPRSAFRYGYRLWIDAENHMLLRSDVVNSHGASLEQILFTEITLPTQIPDELLKPAVNGKEFTWYNENPAETGKQAAAAENWKVQWVPEGFSLHEYRVQKLSAGREPVEHIIYSDGLAMISVFVEKLGKANEPLSGFSSMGAVTAYSTTFSDYQVTAVGEVPPLTVRQVAASVVRSAATQ